MVERVSETTYKLALPADRHSYIQTDNIHRLKLYVTPQANLYCLVVADEVEGDDQPLGKKDGINYNVKGTERSDG